jgi:hypothetical protein
VTAGSLQDFWSRGYNYGNAFNASFILCRISGKIEEAKVSSKLSKK